MQWVQSMQRMRNLIIYISRKRMKKLTSTTLIFGIMIAVGADISYAGSSVPIENNGGTIGNNSCNGYRACCGNSSVIGDNECNEDEACSTGFCDG